jgi:hypothetical protein
MTLESFATEGIGDLPSGGTEQATIARVGRPSGAIGSVPSFDDDGGLAFNVPSEPVATSNGTRTCPLRG